MTQGHPCSTQEVLGHLRELAHEQDPLLAGQLLVRLPQDVWYDPVVIQYCEETPTLDRLGLNAVSSACVHAARTANDPGSLAVLYHCGHWGADPRGALFQAAHVLWKDMGYRNDIDHAPAWRDGARWALQHARTRRTHMRFGENAPGVLYFDPWESWGLGVDDPWTRVLIEFKGQSRKPITMKLMRGDPVRPAEISIPEGLTPQQVAWAIDNAICLSPATNHVDVKMLWQDALRREWMATYLSRTHLGIARWAANDLRCISDELAGQTSLSWERNWKTQHWGA